jgi:hypothetical protein
MKFWCLSPAHHLFKEQGAENKVGDKELACRYALESKRGGGGHTAEARAQGA